MLFRIIAVSELGKEEKKAYSIIVNNKDTLWNIAKKFGSTIQNIADINEIKDFDKLKIGEQLFIPITV